MNATSPAPISGEDDLDAVRKAAEDAEADNAVNLAAWLLAMLRAAGGVRTLGEICADLSVTAQGVAEMLAALEAVGLVHRRDLEMDGVTEPCWWAPRVPFSMPWNKEARR